MVLVIVPVIVLVIVLVIVRLLYTKLVYCRLGDGT